VRCHALGSGGDRHHPKNLVSRQLFHGAKIEKQETYLLKRIQFMELKWVARPDNKIIKLRKRRGC
jgi:hypothetical protein